MLFGDPELNDDSEDAFDKYIYLTQLSQAVCTTEQVNGIFILCIFTLLDIYFEFQLQLISSTRDKKFSVILTKCPLYRVEPFFTF